MRSAKPEATRGHLTAKATVSAHKVQSSAAPVASTSRGHIQRPHPKPTRKPCSICGRLAAGDVAHLTPQDDIACRVVRDAHIENERLAKKVAQQDVRLGVLRAENAGLRSAVARLTMEAVSA